MRTIDTEDLESIELEEGLVAEDVVVAKVDVVDVVSGFLEVGRERGPIEDGHSADIQVIVRAADESLVTDGRGAGDWVDGWLLEIFERDVFRLERVTGFFDTTRGEHALLGGEVGLIELAESGGAEAHEARVLVVAGLRDGREQLGVEDRADLSLDVVEHAVSVHSAIALAEDDIAFHVDLESVVALLCGAIQSGIGVDAPNDDSVGFDVDVAERAEGLWQAVAAETLHDDVDAAADNHNRFAGGRLYAFDIGTKTFLAGVNNHFAEAGTRRSRRHRRGNRLRQHRRGEQLGGLERRLLLLIVDGGQTRVDRCCRRLCLSSTATECAAENEREQEHWQSQWHPARIASAAVGLRRASTPVLRVQFR